MRCSIIFLFFWVQTHTIKAQLRGIQFRLGTGISSPDYRINASDGFEIQSVIQTAVKQRSYTLDNEYFVVIQKTLIDKQKTLLQLGMGYHLFTTDFPYMARQRFFNDYNKNLYWVYDYAYHTIQFPISLHYHFDIYACKVYLGGTIEPHFSFHKTMYVNKPPFLRKFSRTLLEPSHGGGYASFKLAYHSVGLDFAFRTFFVKYKDEAIGNQQEARDTYNTTKIRFGISYQFK